MKLHGQISASCIYVIGIVSTCCALEIWFYWHIKCVKKREVISIWSEATEQHKASLVFVETLEQVFCCKCVMYLFDVLMCHKVSLRFTLQVRANYEASWIIEQIKDIKPATLIALNYDRAGVFIFLCCIYIFSYACAYFIWLGSNAALYFMQQHLLLFKPLTGAHRHLLTFPQQKCEGRRS